MTGEGWGEGERPASARWLLCSDGPGFPVIPAKAGIQARLNKGATLQRPVFHPHPNPLPSRDPCVIVVPAKSLPRTRYGGDPCKSVIPAKGHTCTTRHSGESRNPGPSEQRSHLAEAGLSPSPQPSPVKRPLRNRRSREEPAPYSIRGRPVQIRHSGESRNPAGGGPAWIASFRSPMLLCSESYAKVSEGGNPGLRWSASTMLIHCHDFTLSP